MKYILYNFIPVIRQDHLSILIKHFRHFNFDAEKVRESFLNSSAKNYVHMKTEHYFS